MRTEANERIRRDEERILTVKKRNEDLMMVECKLRKALARPTYVSMLLP